MDTSLFVGILRRHFGRRFAFTVKRAGISQNELARQLGVSSGTISSWVSGRTQPSIEILMAACTILQVDANALLGFDANQRAEASVEYARSELMVIAAKGLAIERMSTAALKKAGAERRDALRAGRASLEQKARGLDSLVIELEKKYLPWIQDEISGPVVEHAASSGSETLRARRKIQARSRRIG